MLDPRLAAFLEFTRQHESDLRRIARRCREATHEDVQNQAWLLADSLAKKHGQDLALYFSDPSFRATLVAHLVNHFVHFRERKIRNSLRLEQTEAHERDRYDSIVAAASIGRGGDPLFLLLAEESSREAFQPSPHDTESGAYLHLLEANGQSMRRLADSLMISVSYCYRRRRRARELCAVQHSLLVGLAHEESLPLRAWRRFPVHREYRKGVCGYPLTESFPLEGDASEVSR